MATSTVYTTLFNLDVSKAVAQLKKFEKTKKKALKAGSNIKFKIDTVRLDKAIKQLEKFHKIKKKAFKISKKTKLKVDTDQIGSAITELKKFEQVKKKALKPGSVTKLKIDTTKAQKSIKNLKKISANTGKNSGASFGKLFTANLSSFLTGSAIIGVFNNLSNSVLNFGKSTFNVFTDVDEQLANIQKTTGLAGDELNSLQSEVFKDIGRNTRTANQELLKIVETGGRLGISEKKDLIPFVKGINKISVALGDEFIGGGDEAVSVVGKLAGSFEELRNLPIDQSLNKIGSAINEVGSSSQGTGGNLANFIGRVGQLPDSIKPSISSTVALGAVLEGAKISSEIASGGISNLLLVASRDLSGFANQIGITTEEARKLVTQDPGEFAVKFSESLKDLSGEELSSVLKDLKLGTQETLKVVGALGAKSDEYAKLQGIANDQIKNATSLTNEYNIKNNTLEANLGKLNNNFNEFQLKVGKFGKAFVTNLPFLDKFSSKLVQFSNFILDLDFEKAGAELGKKLNQSLSRIKLDGLKDIFKNINFNELISVFDTIKNSLGDVFKDLNFDGLVSVFDTIKNSLGSIDFSSLANSLGTLAGDTLSLITTQLISLSNILIGLASQVDIQVFLNALQVTFGILATVVLPALIPAFQSFFELSNAFFLAVGSFGMPILNSLINGFNFLATNIFPILANVFTSTLLPSIQNLFTSLSSLLTNVMPALRLLGLVIGGTVVGAIVLLISIAGGLVAVLAGFVSFLVTVVASFASAGNAIIQFASNTTKAISDFVTKVTGFFSNLTTESATEFASLSANSQTTFTEMSTGLSNTATTLKDNVINLISQLVIDAIAKAGEFAGGMGEAFANAKNVSVEAISSLPSDILGILANLASQVSTSAQSIGTNIGKGVITGIKNQISQIAAEAARMAQAALNSAKSALGIRSPSRKVRDEVGKNYALGYPAAFKKYGGIVMKSVKDFSMDALNTAKDTLSNGFSADRLSNADIPKPSSSPSGLNNQSNVTNNNQRSITQNNSITIQNNDPSDAGDAIIQRLKLISA